MGIIFSILALGGLIVALVFLAKAFFYMSCSIILIFKGFFNANIKGLVAFWNFRKYSIPIFTIISLLLIPFYLILPLEALSLLGLIHFIVWFLIANVLWYISKNRAISLAENN